MTRKQRLELKAKRIQYIHDNWEMLFELEKGKAPGLNDVAKHLKEKGLISPNTYVLDVNSRTLLKETANSEQAVRYEEWVQKQLKEATQ